MRHFDRLERNEIIDRADPYWFDLCSWCGSYEGEPHEDDCRWVRVRTELHLEVAA
jgi:hypothetical protein